VEEHNFDIRKQLLEFDDVMNQQREVIYARRREIMVEEDLESSIHAYLDDVLETMYEDLPKVKAGEEIDSETRESHLARLKDVFALDRVMSLDGRVPDMEEVRQGVLTILEGLKQNAPDHFQEILRFFLLESLDRFWKEHLLNMDHLKEGIGLRGYGQKDPKQEYKREGFQLFQELLFMIKESTLKSLCHIRLREVSEEQLQHQDQTKDLQLQGGDETAASQEPVKRSEPKVGRNDPCPCGSGRKYKKCCGR
jgi:preprotein translocase subunit SecA